MEVEFLQLSDGCGGGLGCWRGLGCGNGLGLLGALSSSTLPACAAAALRLTTPTSSAAVTTAMVFSAVVRTLAACGVLLVSTMTR